MSDKQAKEKPMSLRESLALDYEIKLFNREIEREQQLAAFNTKVAEHASAWIDWKKLRGAAAVAAKAFLDAYPKPSLSELKALDMGREAFADDSATEAMVAKHGLDWFNKNQKSIAHGVRIAKVAVHAGFKAVKKLDAS